MARTGVRVIERVPWWVRFGVCIALVFGYGTLVCAMFADWPWIAAAFPAPLWITLGALYAESRRP